jgi:hypothetical protein
MSCPKRASLSTVVNAAETKAFQGETHMDLESLNFRQEVTALMRLTTKQLRERYTEVFGEETNGNNRTWLIRRIAWRLQALAEGDLSERARARAVELARDADLRMMPPAATKAEPTLGSITKTRDVRFEADNRLPPPGTVLTRKYKGDTVQVKVLTEGFEYAGEVYGSLSAVAKAITGSHCNGFLFFRLKTKTGAA